MKDCKGSHETLGTGKGCQNSSSDVISKSIVSNDENESDFCTNQNLGNYTLDSNTTENILSIPSGSNNDNPVNTTESSGNIQSGSNYTENLLNRQSISNNNESGGNVPSGSNTTETIANKPSGSNSAQSAPGQKATSELRAPSMRQRQRKDIGAVRRSWPGKMRPMYLRMRPWVRITGTVIRRVLDRFLGQVSNKTY